ncbi:MAG: ADP-glyceromanno-heptose 6-epimerase [Desulfovibrionaceae bacterium]
MYIVTGGAGFIGSALIWKLNSEGIRDILIVDNLASSEKWKNLIGKQFCDYLHKDTFLKILRKDGLPKHIKGIIHLGACSSTTEINADYLMENNFHYTVTLCKYALKHGIRFLNASSASTYGDGSQGFNDDLSLIPLLRPLNMYGYTKQLFDLWTIQNGYENTIASFKFFNVYGPNEYHKESMRSVILKSFIDIKEGKHITLFKSYKKEYADGEQKRDFVYIKDCVSIICTFLMNPQFNGIFNIGTGHSRTWKDLALAVYKALNMKENIEFIEMPETLKEKYQYYTQANMQKLSDLTGLTCQYSLEDGIKDYILEYLQKENSYL